MLPTVCNELGKAHFRATAVDGVGVSVRLGVGGLRADLGCLPLEVEGKQGLVGLRVDLG